ncbi:MAG: alpha-glucosidase [Anaerolineaceae bacterium 4572_5.1]|nr:MAG: alpha-glucosidase [Anaerolineaceae bacterium 4572_5.1]RLD03654.1 MAG: alpha-glucosidase [Chloroflexota bacterium]
MKKTIVLIGAGSAMFGLGTVGDILKSEPLKGSHIVLHDINAQTLDTVTRVVQKEINEKNLPYTVSATTSRQEALQGADFCVISIEVGNRFDLWEQDWKTPLLYGFHQIYGENGGPGGLFHSLRIIPPILEICGDINTICPDAYVFNFSNPMTRICLAINRKYPNLKVIGLCHEIASIPHHLPHILNTPLSNLSFRAGGLNHFSVLLDVIYKDTGQDAYPDLRANAPAYFEHTPSVADLFEEAFGGAQALSSKRFWSGRWLFKEILERFGYLPITDDSHFGEYIQWAYDTADHQDIENFYNRYKKWSLELAVPESRIAGTKESEYWRAIPIIEGIIGDTHQEEHAVNIMNNGLINNLPQDLAVEVPAIVDKNGVHGVKLGNLPKGIAGLLNNQAATIDLTAEAAITGSREIVFQALLLDPVVDSVRRAEALLDTMLELQKKYLGYIQ